MEITNPDLARIDPVAYLVAKSPLPEYLGYVQAHSIQGAKVDVGELAEQWRAAYSRTQQLEAEEGGIADNASAASVSDELAHLSAAVLADPMFQKSFAIVPATLGMIDLDKVVVFQRAINLRYSEQIAGRLADGATPEAVFRVCLPFDHPKPAVRLGRVAGNAFAFTSESTDLRFLEAVLLEGGQLQDYVPTGPVCGVIGLVTGFGCNFLNVLAVGGRLIMNNGNHRAYSLRRLGIRHIPAVIQHITHVEELDAVTAAIFVERKEAYLSAPRPPMLKDFFDSVLCREISVPRRNRQVRVTFGVEALDVPA